MLESIKSPEQVKRLSEAEKCALADEIRRSLIETVSETGGHLASNLGVVELTIALHSAFDAPRDKLLFDVGHQAYAHKMLTGRFSLMKTLRQKDGLSGFPRMEESEYDCVNAGHASDALSLALGMARARDLQGESNHIVAVVGDGALTGGMCYEALNDAGQSKTKLIIVLNDNEMSISKNVGALSMHLTHMRQSSFYRSFKQSVRRLLTKLPRLGDRLTRVLIRLRDSVKSLFISDTFFNSLGIEYLGPIDGNNIGEMIKVFDKAKEADGPVVIHVVTQKGRGYLKAEERPDRYHGIAPFFVDSGEARKSAAKSAGEIAAQHLVRSAGKDTRIVAVTAAMLNGTGLKAFKKAFPERCFDVGIAEEHAVAMAAGMALNGLKPFVAVYSTFLQRAYDQVMMDACLNGANVTFLVDRAGLNGADGETHQGVFDIGFLRSVPNLTLACPSDGSEMRRMIDLSLEYNGPMAIRYPKEMKDDEREDTFSIGQWQEISKGTDGVIIAGGRMLKNALDAQDMLIKKDVKIGVINARFIKPMDEDMLLKAVRNYKRIFVLEDGAVSGGFGEGVNAFSVKNAGGRVHIIGVKDAFIAHASVSEQMQMLNMDANSVCEYVQKMCEEEINAASCR
ncbi:MAG: 1-deoxy-D-xylulose-5-phosphate synthase [Clostridia bacterium]|nr:1-deoxy-D-xylulose-5-phosphate synthase [Clostridia bacterium]